MINMEFEKVEPVENIRQVLQDVFEVDLNIEGGWGYDNNTATIVNNLDVPLDQFVHMYSTIRATIEMNLMLDEENRFGGINTNFEESKKFEIENKTYDVLTFKITAINEKMYAKFIKEYKDGYGKKEFDLSDHFKRREENTVSRYVDYWFVGLKEEE